MVLTTFNIDSSLSEKKIKQNILTSISPFIFKICRDVKSKFDFLDLSITSRTIFTNIISTNTNDSFSNYLKGFKID